MNMTKFYVLYIGTWHLAEKRHFSIRIN